MRINILEYFNETMVKCSDRVAVIDGSSKYSFAQLDEDSEKLCKVISGKIGDLTCKPLAVFLPKCYSAIVSDIAIIKTGNAYMNLDIKTPFQRIGSILALIRPEIIITQKRFLKGLLEIYPLEKIVVLDDVNYDTAEIKCGLDSTRYKNLIDTDPLCIINTSGSTGTPKGVILNHRSFIDFIEWSLSTMPFSEHEVIGSLSPVIFDIYSYELCLLMAKGATMVLIPDMFAAFPVKILQLLRDEKVSYIFWVPTIMVNIANLGLLEKVKVDTLKIVWFAGEVFPTKQFNIWRRALPYVMFVNMYGPIEITLDCTHYVINRELKDDEPIPIGYAMRNTDILLLNENDQLCSPGEEGELCVRGTSLAMGYYNNPEKTAAAFVQNPLNKSYPEIIYRTGDVACVNEFGEIVFKGRRDTLVKHSGYRIELGEIEHVVVNTLGLFSNACVVYDYTKKEIILIYESDEDIDVGQIKKSISKSLPRYMIPNIYIRVQEMPRNPNGKIDRLRLKQWVLDEN